MECKLQRSKTFSITKISKNQNPTVQSLLNWINKVLVCDIETVEQLATGAAFCQLLHMAYPAEMPLHRVKFEAALEHEFIFNFKHLEAALKKLKLKSSLPLMRLTKGCYEELLELLLLISDIIHKKMDDSTVYDAIAARDGKKIRFLEVGRQKSRGLSSRPNTARVQTRVDKSARKRDIYQPTTPLWVTRKSTPALNREQITPGRSQTPKERPFNAPLKCKSSSNIAEPKPSYLPPGQRAETTTKNDSSDKSKNQLREREKPTALLTEKIARVKEYERKLKEQRRAFDRIFGPGGKYEGTWRLMTQWDQEGLLPMIDEAIKQVLHAHGSPRDSGCGDGNDGRSVCAGGLRAPSLTNGNSADTANQDRVATDKRCNEGKVLQDLIEALKPFLDTEGSFGDDKKLAVLTSI